MRKRPLDAETGKGGMGPAALVTGPGWEGSGPLEGQWGGVSSLCLKSRD